MGAAIVIAGGVFWALRTSEANTLSGECPNNQCPSSDTSAASDISNGKMYDDVSVAFFAVGGAAVVAGAALLIFGGHSSASTTARLLPSVGPQGGGLRLVGSF